MPQSLMDRPTPYPLFCKHVYLSTCKALDLGRRSDADPRALLSDLASRGMAQDLAVNDLEQPAFDM